MSNGEIYIYKKSIILGILLFVTFTALDLLSNDEVDWLATLSGSSVGALVYYAFEVFEPKEKENEE